VDDLPVEVAAVDHVVIHYTNHTHARRGKIQEAGGGEAACGWVGGWVCGWVGEWWKEGSLYIHMHTPTHTYIDMNRPTSTNHQDRGIK
jgi:hypothetical protein